MISKSYSTIIIVELTEITSAKSVISPVDFHPRLAVSKWIAPRSFSMGGVLGYPSSFLVDTWQAKVGVLLPLPTLDKEQVAGVILISKIENKEVIKLSFGNEKRK